MTNQKSPEQEFSPSQRLGVDGENKAAYIPPVLEFFGKVSNFTTGGSGKRSEYEWENSGMGMGMMGEKECVRTSMSMMRNTVKC